MYQVMFRNWKSFSCISLSMAQNRKGYFNNAMLELLKKYMGSFLLWLVPQYPYMLCAKIAGRCTFLLPKLSNAHFLSSPTFTVTQLIYLYAENVRHNCFPHGNPKLFLNSMCSPKSTATMLED